MSSFLGFASSLLIMALGVLIGLYMKAKTWDEIAQKKRTKVLVEGAICFCCVITVFSPFCIPMYSLPLVSAWTRRKNAPIDIIPCNKHRKMSSSLQVCGETRVVARKVIHAEYAMTSCEICASLSFSCQNIIGISIYSPPSPLPPLSPLFSHPQSSSVISSPPSFLFLLTLSSPSASDLLTQLTLQAGPPINEEHLVSEHQYPINEHQSLTDEQQQSLGYGQHQPSISKTERSASNWKQYSWRRVTMVRSACYLSFDESSMHWDFILPQIRNHSWTLGCPTKYNIFMLLGGCLLLSW